VALPLVTAPPSTREEGHSEQQLDRRQMNENPPLGVSRAAMWVRVVMVGVNNPPGLRV
jgi:hypothetical protein